MEYTKKYTKEEAIRVANEFIEEVNKLEEKYSMNFNSDTGDVYFSFENKDKERRWGYVELGWEGDGTGIKVMEEIVDKEKIREEALNKLTDEEKEVLGLN